MTRSISGLFVLSTVLFLVSCRPEIKDFEEISRKPVLFPDYTDIVLPYNIAPLNFTINEPGTEYEVRMYVHRDKAIRIRTTHASIRIHPRKWKKMLLEGKGSNLFMEVFVRNDHGNWIKFKTISNRISPDKIDDHLVYRLINTGYVLFRDLGIYQRNLENFDEKPLVENKSIDYDCLNCHSFCKNDPETMLFHVRGVHGGTFFARDGQYVKVKTKTAFTLKDGVYPCWHPDGRHVVFSVNNINQFFCNGDVRIEVSDDFSDLVVYDAAKKTVTTAPEVSTANRENLPVWSPDGKFIYYISAPPARDLESRYRTRYDLLRVAYNVQKNVWGKVDTVLSSKKIGKSISFPKISPDGRFLIFCTSDYGYFTIHHPMADLYLLDLTSGVYKKLDINSPQTDSYHSFSSNGRWIVFSSKRLDGLYSRPFFTHFDKNGNTSKPFVLPQERSEFYHVFIKNYNIPELVDGEVKISPTTIRDIVMKDAVPSLLDPKVDTTYMKTHLNAGKR